MTIGRSGLPRAADRLLWARFRLAAPAGAVSARYLRTRGSRRRGRRRRGAL